MGLRLGPRPAPRPPRRRHPPRPAGPRPRRLPAWNAAAPGRIGPRPPAPGPSPRPSCSPSSTPTTRCGRGLCGGGCTRPPPAPARSSPSTSPIWTLAVRCAVVVGKGGRAEVIGWETKTARLLPRHLHRRRDGPVFLTDIVPAPARQPALADFDPATGRARPSYRRAAEIFTTASGGWTLHQIRHSRLTHLAEAGVGLPMLMSKSRHTSLPSLAIYAKPTFDAVAAAHRRARPRPTTLTDPTSQSHTGHRRSTSPNLSRLVQGGRRRHVAAGRIAPLIASQPHAPAVRAVPPDRLGAR